MERPPPRTAALHARDAITQQALPRLFAARQRAASLKEEVGDLTWAMTKPLMSPEREGKVRRKLLLVVQASISAWEEVVKLVSLCSLCAPRRHVRRNALTCGP